MPRQPTEAELAILRVLWELGSSTVRQIHNRLTQSKDIGYATTVKMLVIMFEKGLVKRNDSIRPQIYRAAITQRRAQQKMLNDLLHKVYDGSAKSLVQQLLSSRKSSPEEIREIRELLDELEGGS
jgi:BlaI family penicillinase repressor